MFQVRYKEKTNKSKINILLAKFNTKIEAETYINIENTQMEMDESKGKMYIVKEK